MSGASSRASAFSSAGLAGLAWAQGDIGGALREVNALLAWARAGAPGDAVGGPRDDSAPFAIDATDTTDAAGNVDGAEYPRLIELTVYRVLAAAGDPRASAWLQRAHSALMAQADAITDAALRQMFLTNIPHRRDIVALWAARGASIAAPAQPAD